MLKKSIIVLSVLCMCVNPGFAENLVKKTVLTDMVDILVPESFIAMPDDTRVLRYKGNDPAVVYMSRDGLAILAITYQKFDGPVLHQENTNEITRILQQADFNDIAWMNKRIVKLELKKRGERNFGVRHIVMQQLSGELTEVQYITSIQGYQALFSFTYPTDQASTWKPMGEEILNSIMIHE